MTDGFAIIVNHSRPGRAARPPLFPTTFWYNYAPIKAMPLNGICSSFGGTAGHILFFRSGAASHQGLFRKHLIKGVIRAGRKASRMGARIVGLDPTLIGALGNSAAAIARKLGVTITDGSGYTVLAVTEALRKASDLMGLFLEEASVLVLGAAEPFGAVCTQILARDGANYLTLVDRDSARLDNLARRLLYDSGVACKISTEAGKLLARADLVIIVDGAADAALHIHDLKSGAVVCNLGVTDELSLDIMKGRPDVMVFDGVAVRPPGAAVPGCAPGFPEGNIHAWMAEAILLALEGRYDRYFLGRELHVEKVLEMKRLAVKHGFNLSGFIAANRYFDFDCIQGIKKKLKKKAIS